MHGLRKRSVLLSSLLTTLGGCLALSSCLAPTYCTKAREKGKEPAVRGSADANGAEEKREQRQPSTPGIAFDPKEKGQSDPSEAKNGPSYLVVLASWTLNPDRPGTSVPEELAVSLAPQSVKMAEGFPRPANAQESTALPSGYGALLAGVCSDSASAESALASLRAEDFDADLKETELKLPANCPLPSRQWQLDRQLLLAAESDKPDALAEATALLDQGASPQGIGARSPLDLAAYQNDIALTRLLLERGAQPNRPQRAPQQESALELALRTPHGDPFEMVRLLVKHGADVNAQTEGAEADPGSTVQLAAIRGCYPKILTYLREKGARPHAVSADEVCRDRLPSEAVRTALLAMLRIGSEESF